MNNNYASRIEDYFEGGRSYLNGNEIDPRYYRANITDLVKKWYSGEPNNGIMLKAYNENYVDDMNPEFFSKNNTVIGYNPKPILEITYRNQNGLENYMTYQTHSFSNGTVHLNNYNGNLTAVFDLASTISGKLPANLALIYNTNDVVLNNNYGYGIGNRLNLHQMIKEITIEDINYLEYHDMDGTLHYFVEENNIYHDEDGLSMTITKTNNDYILKDKNNNRMKFINNNGLWYLKEVIDTSNNKIILNFDTNNRIIKVIDANNGEINLTYSNNQIVINYLDKTIYLNYANNLLTNITNYLGITSFLYNENNVINKITDNYGTCINYEYYSAVPYRIKKVTEIGLNNSVGAFIEFSYNYNSTTITDNKNRVTTHTFNNYGNEVSISNLKSGEDVIDAYGSNNIVGEFFEYKNKLTEEYPNIKYVNNLLTNTSFEDSNNIFINENGITTILSNEESHYGSKSLKVINTEANKSIYKTISVPKNKNYTFSAYIKNTNIIELSLSYLNELNEIISESNIILSNNIFKRYDISILYPSNATSDLTIKITNVDIGTTYIDDMQLEEGNVANAYNFIENSNFANGLTDWLNNNDDNTNVSLVTLENGNKAVNLHCNPDDSSSVNKTINVSGFAGDSYNLSFWYKNTGIDPWSLPFSYGNAIINFGYYEDLGMGIDPGVRLTPNNNEWQFYSENFYAEADYKDIWFSIFRENNVNDLYITNITLSKNINSGSSYDYDTNGNTTQVYDDGVRSLFDYDNNNQLIKITDEQGANFNYEYDNNVTNRVINSISPTGITNGINYDLNGNPYSTKITNIGNNIETNKKYYIRLKGTNKYLKRDLINIIALSDNCSNDTWQLIKVDNYYRLKLIPQNKYLTVIDNIVSLTNILNDNSLFELIKNNNRSYYIKQKNTNKYLKNNNDNIVIDNHIDNDYNEEFYFIDSSNKLFMENTAIYTEDGKYLTKTIDALFNETTYNVNETNGLINSLIDSKGNITNYTYNDKEQITKVKQGNQEVNYTYNNLNLLSRINHGTKDYNFTYDNFLNINNIKIGNERTLITNNYEPNNGNLISSTYGNNQTINFEYDNFERMKKVTKLNDTYNYHYDNLGNLSKVIANNDTYRYYYNDNSKINEYFYNDFNLKFNYDNLGNITNKYYSLNNINKNINYTFNQDNAITKTTFNDNEINYSYDYLGRIINKNLNK